MASEEITKVKSDATVAPAADMSVYEAIYRRRSAWKYKDNPVARETMERMLDTAVWAPNHRLTEPWRFFIIEKGTEARDTVAELAYQHQMGRFDNPQRAEATRQSVLAPPVLIYVYSAPGQSDEATKENYASTICAAYNVSLAGAAEGLTVTWETGGATRHPKLKETLGAEEEWDLAAMLSIGEPDEDIVTQRTPAQQFAKWL